MECLYEATSIRPGALVTLRNEGAEVLKQVSVLYVTPFIAQLETVVMEADARFLDPDALTYVVKRMRLEESNYIFDEEAETWISKTTWTC